MKQYDPEKILEALRPESATSPVEAPEDKPEVVQETARLEDEPVQAQDVHFPDPAASELPDKRLPLLAAHANISAVPAGTRFGFFKKVAHRLLRIVSGPQVTFNYETLKSLSVLAEHSKEVDICLRAIENQSNIKLKEQDSVIRTLAAQVEALRLDGEKGRNLISEELNLLRQDFLATKEDLEKKIWTVDDQRKGVEKALEETEKKIWSVDDSRRETDTNLRSLIQDKVTYLEERLERLDDVMRDWVHSRLGEQDARLQGDMEGRLRRILKQIRDMQPAPPSPETSTASAAPSSNSTSFADDLAYELYEDQWRGDPEQVQAGQQDYVRLLQEALKEGPETGDILDMGCGRGEFLKALQEAGMTGKGVDLNRVAVERAREMGLDAVHGDGLAFMMEAADDSFRAITAFQVVEHLEPAQLRHFLDLTERKLAPGGLVLMETLNPAVFAAHRWYWMDLTHRHFLPAETLRFTCECAGLEHRETRFLHPVAEHEQLKLEGDATEKANLELLNKTLFGPQDYYVLARKPGK